MWTTTKMDIGFYPENEQFTCNMTPFLDYSRHHSSYFEREFESFSAMPEPPSQIFEWEDNDASDRLQPAPYLDVANQRQRVDMGHANAFPGTIGTPMSIGSPMSTPVSLVPIPSSIEPKTPVIPIRENRPAPTTTNTFPLVPLGPTCYEFGHCNSVLTPITKNVPVVKESNESNANSEPASISSFQDLELQDFITGDVQQLNLSPTKKHSTFNPDCMLMSGCRRQSECSDILNTSFTSTDFANFDMDKYIFDEDKQSKHGTIETRDQTNSLTSINSKTEIISEGCNSTVKPTARKLSYKARTRAGGKKLDHVARQYIVTDTKKPCSEDEDDVDIETVSEEEPGPILQAGNITDLLEQFEATEMKAMLEEKLETVEEKYLKAPNKTEKLEDHVAAKSKHKGRKRKCSGTSKANKPEKDNTKMITPENDLVKSVRSEKDNVKSSKNSEKNYPKRAKIETTDVKPNASVKQEQLSKKNIMSTIKPTAQQDQLVKKNIESTAKPPAKSEQVLNKNVVNTVKPPTAQQAQFAQKNVVGTIKSTAKQDKLIKKNNASAVKSTAQHEKLVKKNSANTARNPAKPEPVLNKSIVNTVTAQQVQLPQKNVMNTIKPTAKQEKLINKNNVTPVKSKPIQGASSSSKPSVLTESSHFMNCYPTELINRIKESGKRKTITVIDPIPHNHIKRRKIQDSCNKVVVKTVSPINRHTVQLEHNYCTKKVANNSNVGIVKAPVSNKKDTAFTLSSSDDDNKKVINGQPMTKNADGTLMVSLLKSNTIPQVETSSNKKKTLNLDEYKKRRNPCEVTKNSHEKSPPSTSTSTSPQPEPQPETEHQRMLKHQEKLRRMAQEVLKAAPKADKDQKPKCNSNMLPTTPGKSGLVRRAEDLKNKTETQTKMMMEHSRAVARPLRVPPNLERKIYVSIGVNTDFRIPRDQDPLAPLETLQELKPLLEQSSHRINDQSLISSMIQHVPKVVQQRESALSRMSMEASYNNGEHGECKQVVYLEKNRVKRPTKSITTQTNISLISQRSNVRMQSTATSSRHTSPGTSYRSERSSRPTHGSYSSSRGSETSPGSTSISPASSVHSSAGWSRASSHSGSRSRTHSPSYSRKSRYMSNAYREYLNAVEERRIIYVGKVPCGTTKEDLWRKFRKFGPITKVSLHFRDIGENYGFVNFTFKEDAHEAYARGNEDPKYPPYKISFGGRREFCKAAYSDLDYANDDPYHQSSASNDSYDDMLQDMLDIVHLREA
ncbi:serine-rich adhesin for platelets [Euwallacea similis]|uniref:serine-rich adhesin for platelets n=1 Tax=Euwallacea similis TaxID=1736056 RepID=UPI00344E7D2A